MSMVEISIIVVSYNTKELTLDCLRSIFNSKISESYEVIVIDNASADGTATAIHTEFGERILLISANINYGFASGNNEAARIARGSYILLLNPDTLLMAGAVDNLMQFSRKYPDAGIWGGRTLFPDGSLNPASCWQRQTLWSLTSQALGFSSLFRRSTIFNPEGIGGWNRAGQREVDIVSGCFLLIKRDLWNSLGGFRKEFFMYGEEADLCLRAHAVGARPMVSSEATIVHYGGASETVRADKLVRLLKAKMLLIQYHFPRPLKGLGRILIFLWPVRQYLGHLILSLAGRSKSQKDREAWWGVLWRKSEWYIPNLDN